MQTVFVEKLNVVWGDWKKWQATWYAIRQVFKNDSYRPLSISISYRFSLKFCCFLCFCRQILVPGFCYYLVHLSIDVGVDTSVIHIWAMLAVLDIIYRRGSHANRFCRKTKWGDWKKWQATWYAIRQVFENDSYRPLSISIPIGSR